MIIQSRVPQVLTRIIDNKDYSFIEDNHLTKEMFPGYEEEFEFIQEHYKQYGNIPDAVTFQARFTGFDFVDVEESDDYLLQALKNDYAISKIGLFISKVSEIASTSGIDALDYLKSHVDEVEDISTTIPSENIIATVDDRVEHSKNVSQSTKDFFIPTGFDDLDKDIDGFQRGDELVVLFARTNQGKSWIAEKIASYMSELGYSVGYFSPEMNQRDIGYRFDTLHGHLSNNAMRLGRFNDSFTVEDYTKYAKELKRLTGKLYVTRPKDFNRTVTVSKLRQWIKSDSLQALFIDGITYLTDERYKRGDSKTISLTNISEDLMELSAEMKLPIIVVVQANRGGILDKTSTETPELENIRDSDGIAQNASIVYAIRQVKDKDGSTFLIFDNKKMRGGEVGKSYKYKWDINTGEFTKTNEIQMDDGSVKQQERKAPTADRKRARQTGEDEY